MTCANCLRLEAENRRLRALLDPPAEDLGIRRLRDRFGLTDHQARFVFRLYQGKGEMVAKVALMDAMPARDPDDHRTADFLRVQLVAIRQRLGVDTIQTIAGRGYTLTPYGRQAVAEALAGEYAG